MAMFPPANLHEMRYWRDIAMDYGHRNLDPGFVVNAIRDIAALNQPFPPAGAATPSWCHPTPLANPVRPLEPHPSVRPAYGSVRHHPYPLPPQHRRPSSAAQANPHHVNPGIQVDPNPVIPPLQVHPPPRPSTVPPHHQGWNQLPPVPPPMPPPAPPPAPPPMPPPGGFNANPVPNGPVLPRRQPDHNIWHFPAGMLTWTPHPQPHPHIPPAQFFGHNPVIGAPPRPWPYQSPGLWTGGQLTGGWPLPGTCPQWTPGQWPPMPWPHAYPVRLAQWLIPNPLNAHLPLIDWDVSKNPVTAKRLTGAHVSLDMNDIWKESATHPVSKKIHVLCDAGHMAHLWGPIIIDQTSRITIRDLFDAIFKYFQTPLTAVEVRHVASLGANNYACMEEAYYQRCRHSHGLPGYEFRQGFRRVDCLGDRRHFWGLWITYGVDGTWVLNLGLINPAHRQPGVV